MGAFLVPGPLTYPASLHNAIHPLTSIDSSKPKINTLMDDLRMEPEKVNIQAKACYILSSV